MWRDKEDTYCVKKNNNAHSADTRKELNRHCSTGCFLILYQTFLPPFTLKNLHQAIGSSSVKWTGVQGESSRDFRVQEVWIKLISWRTLFKDVDWLQNPQSELHLLCNIKRIIKLVLKDNFIKNALRYFYVIYN